MPIDFACAYQQAFFPGRNRPLEFYQCVYSYMSLLPANPLIVEVGTYLGKSLIVMACALAGQDFHIVTMDPIHKAGTITCPDANQPVQYYEGDTLGLEYRLTLLGLRQHVTILPMTSMEALAQWDGRQIDFVVIDAEHTAAAVQRDCQWLDYVKIGGYVQFNAGHYGAIDEGANAYFVDHPGWELVHHLGHLDTGGWHEGIFYDQTLCRKTPWAR